MFTSIRSKKEVEVLDLCESGDDEESGGGSGKPPAQPERGSEGWKEELFSMFTPSFAIAERVPGVGKSGVLYTSENVSKTS